MIFFNIEAASTSFEESEIFLVEVVFEIFFLIPSKASAARLRTVAFEAIERRGRPFHEFQILVASSRGTG